MTLKYIAGEDIKQIAGKLLKGPSPYITVMKKEPIFHSYQEVDISQVTVPFSTETLSAHDVLERLLEYTISLERDMEELMYWSTRDKEKMSPTLSDTSEFIEHLIDHERIVWHD